MIDLKDCTFIIPIRIESEDRMRNVITVLCHLLRNFDTKVILKEVDTESVFKKEVLPQIEEYLGDGINNLKHVFEKSDDPVFYRMKIINEMIDMSDTPIIANYDGDVVFKLETYTEAVEMIRGEYDIVYPYGFGNYQKQVEANDGVVSQFLETGEYKYLDEVSNIHTSDFGWAQFFKTKVYREGGMENENFKAYAPEDKERYYRFTTLGYNVGRINDYVYHLEHALSLIHISEPTRPY